MLKTNPIILPIIPSITPETSQIVSQEKLIVLLKEIKTDLEKVRSCCDTSYIHIQEAYTTLGELNLFFNKFFNKFFKKSEEDDE